MSQVNNRLPGSDAQPPSSSADETITEVGEQESLLVQDTDDDEPEEDMHIDDELEPEPEIPMVSLKEFLESKGHGDATSLFMQQGCDRCPDPSLLRLFRKHHLHERLISPELCVCLQLR